MLFYNNHKFLIVFLRYSHLISSAGANLLLLTKSKSKQSEAQHLPTSSSSFMGS